MIRTKIVWAALVVMVACTPTKPNPQPPTPNTQDFDIVACRRPWADNQCDQVAAVTFTVDGLDGDRVSADGYLFAQLPADRLKTRIHMRAAGFLPFDSGDLVVTDLTGQNSLGNHNFFVLTEDVPPVRPIPSKASFIQNYQGNFGSIKVPGCGFFNDSLFDPVALLVSWTNNRPCFETAMQAHASRNDNRVVVDPRADYHGGQGGGIIDLWHDPATFAAFVSDIRRHQNAAGEPFEVLLFTAADGHIPSFLARDGHQNLTELEHWTRDVDGILEAVGSQVAGVTPCWECRHQRDYMRPATFEAMGKHLRAKLPAAWVGVHLIQGSSSVSSWRCGNAADPACDAEPDDPFIGSEPGFWSKCRADGWCDGLLFQFEAGDPYTNPAAHPNYTGQPGALGRYWEVIVRLGNDPQSAATAGGNRHGWVQADVLAFEFIYDAYNNRSTEAYGVDWCKRALAIGGWGCGSGSYRRQR